MLKILILASTGSTKKTQHLSRSSRKKLLFSIFFNMCLPRGKNNYSFMISTQHLSCLSAPLICIVHVWKRYNFKGATLCENFEKKVKPKSKLSNGKSKKKVNSKIDRWKVKIYSNCNWKFTFSRLAHI